MFKLLIIGPFPPPITGNSLSNKVILDSLSRRSMLTKYINFSYSSFSTDLGNFSFQKAFRYLKNYIFIYKLLGISKVYITPGQTFFGVLKYSPFILFSKLLGKEIIIHIHGNYLWQEYEKLKGIKKIIFRFIISRADKGIVLSKSLRKNLEPFLSSNKIYELSNFVENYLFDVNIDKKINNRSKNLRIVYLSNLMKEKGIIDLLDALLILKREKIPFKAKLAGHIDSKIEDEIKKYLNFLGEKVEYLGVVYDKKKKELLEWGNIFVFPTYYKIEGQPISILEAMATGNIILTTRHGGIPDIFKEEINGFYIEKKNPEDIAKKLRFLYERNDIWGRIMQNNRIEAENKYRVETFINNLLKILED